eukprot:TRINITY_DN93746_c0_g1_i1.p1 TRINITY_DN93746_c0_g1~~TRINITY_DN93746_c0_g1_i1.p1  ORF type:complete len:596 (+),score=58.01 TRINITY_DN93746_c0_g1_i1:196-1983(+)
MLYASTVWEHYIASAELVHQWLSSVVDIVVTSFDVTNPQQPRKLELDPSSLSLITPSPAEPVAPPMTERGMNVQQCPTCSCSCHVNGGYAEPLAPLEVIDEMGTHSPPSTSPTKSKLSPKALNIPPTTTKPILVTMSSAESVSSPSSSSAAQQGLSCVQLPPPTTNAVDVLKLFGDPTNDNTKPDLTHLEESSPNGPPPQNRKKELDKTSPEKEVLQELTQGSGTPTHALVEERHTNVTNGTNNHHRATTANRSATQYTTAVSAGSTTTAQWSDCSATSQSSDSDAQVEFSMPQSFINQCLKIVRKWQEFDPSEDVATQQQDRADEGAAKLAASLADSPHRHPRRRFTFPKHPARSISSHSSNDNDGQPKDADQEHGPSERSSPAGQFQATATPPPEDAPRHTPSPVNLLSKNLESRGCGRRVGWRGRMPIVRSDTSSSLPLLIATTNNNLRKKYRRTAQHRQPTHNTNGSSSPNTTNNKPSPCWNDPMSSCASSSMAADGAEFVEGEELGTPTKTISTIVEPTRYPQQGTRNTIGNTSNEDENDTSNNISEDDGTPISLIATPPTPAVDSTVMLTWQLVGNQSQSQPSSSSQGF